MIPYMKLAVDIMDEYGHRNKAYHTSKINKTNVWHITSIQVTRGAIPRVINQQQGAGTLRYNEQVSIHIVKGLTKADF